MTQPPGLAGLQACQQHTGVLWSQHSLPQRSDRPHSLLHCASVATGLQLLPLILPVHNRQPEERPGRVSHRLSCSLRSLAFRHQRVHLGQLRLIEGGGGVVVDGDLRLHAFRSTVSSAQDHAPKRCCPAVLQVR